jgi:hypothetical protein
MDFGLDVGGIIKQDIEHVVAFMVVGANDLRMDGDMVGYQSIRNNAFFKSEVLG